MASDGQRIYVADTYNSKIKLLDPRTQEISTYAGEKHGWRDGSDALFYEPGGLDIADGNLYIADTNNHAIRVLSLESGDVRTLVISGIESVAPSVDNVGYLGHVIELAPIELTAGEGKNGRQQYKFPIRTCNRNVRKKTAK